MSNEEKKPTGHYPFHKKSPVKKKDKDESAPPFGGKKAPPCYGVFTRNK